MAPFPNLARRIDWDKPLTDDDRSELQRIDNIVLAELTAVGLVSCTEKFNDELRNVVRRRNGEVPTCHVGTFSDDLNVLWSFERAWRYWVATGPGIPPDIAIVLHESHGTTVRTNGHAGGMHPLAYCRGLAIGHYHVDTSEGLAALVDAIKKSIARYAVCNP